MYDAFVYKILIVPMMMGPILTAGVGPDGVTMDPQEPHYLMVNLTVPETPRTATPADDCASSSRPDDAVDGALDVVSPILMTPPDPTTIGSVEPYFPRCIAIPLSVCTPSDCEPGWLYASYNVSTGRYYVEASLAGMVPHGRPSDVAVTGRTGVEVTADCVGCPPWKDTGG